MSNQPDDNGDGPQPVDVASRTPPQTDETTTQEEAFAIDNERMGTDEMPGGDPKDESFAADLHDEPFAADWNDEPFDADRNNDEPFRPEEGRTQRSDGPLSVLVRMRVPGQTAEFDAGSWDLHVSQLVLVEADHGQAVGTVVRAPQKRRRQPMPRVVRPVNEEDLRIIERNRVREREAHHFCVERIKARDLPMKLISVDLAHSGTRAVFYFSSADRVDFRSLVKDLARRFHTRIEMRQIGVRDAARHTGGLGICGRELCCATWLCAFKPISIRMAKDQNLALNHQKLSGLCGRLRCCLQYEQELYQTQRKGLPKVGKRVVTPEGEGRVKDVNVLRRLIRVQLLDGGYAQYEADDVQRPTEQQQQQQQQQRQQQQQQEPRQQQARPEARREPTRQEPAKPSGRPTSRDAKSNTPQDADLVPPTSGPEDAQPSTDGDAGKENKPGRSRRRRRRGRRGRKPKSDQGGNDSGGGNSNGSNNPPRERGPSDGTKS